MSVRVSASTTLEQLQRALEPHGQWVPLLLPAPAQTTVGGMLASGYSGPLRLGYRGLRDLVLGIKVATAEGSLVHTGGTIVKDVAGYDLAKLYLGSRGSLGVILEAILRTYPLPEHSSTLVAAFPEETQAQRAFERLMTAGLPISMLDLCDPDVLEAMPAVPAVSNAWALIAGAEGAEVVADWIARRAREMCVDVGAATVARLVAPLSNQIRMLAVQATEHAGALLSARLSLPAAVTFTAIATGRALAANAGMTAHALAHAGNGIVHLHLLPRETPPPDDSLLDLCQRLNQQAAHLEGSILWQHVPERLKPRLDLWAPLGKDFALMRRLKQRLDPRAVMSPGRFIGRL